MGTIAQDHKLMVSASNCHRIMTCLDKDCLPPGAISYISDMFNLSDDDFKNTYMSDDMINGVEKEPEALDALSEYLWLDILFTGHTQKRLYAGKDYYDFLSALPDGIIWSLDDLIYSVEVKCLNEKNHQFVCENITDGDRLKKHDYKKYCQVQTQMLCVEKSYIQDSVGIIAFYNEICEPPLHIVWVDPDQEWRDRLHSRLGLAKKLYLEIQGEPQKQVIPLAHDTEIITPDMVSSLLSDPKFLMEMVYDHFGVSIVDGHYTGGDIIDCSTKKGRDQAIKLRSKITKVRTGAVSISKKLVEEYKLKCKQELEFRKTIEADCKALSDYLCQTLNAWESGQKQNVEVKKEIKEAVKEDNVKNVLDPIKNMFEAGKIGIAEALMMAYQAGLDT